MDKKIKINGDSRYIDAGILARYDFGSIIKALGHMQKPLLDMVETTYQWYSKYQI